MVNRLMRLEGYGQQWGVAVGIGFLTWFLGISFAKILPAPLQLLTMLIPIACFSYALWILPKWQKEGSRQDLIDSLVEREGAHKLMRQHHLNLGFIDREFEQTAQAMDEAYGIDPEPITATPHAELSLPDKASHLLRVQQEVMQACGDIGWLFVEYVSSKGAQYCDSDGWINVDKLRSNWARNYGLNADNLKQLMIALNNIQIGEWRDSSMREWRLLLSQ